MSQRGDKLVDNLLKVRGKVETVENRLWIRKGVVNNSVDVKTTPELGEQHHVHFSTCLISTIR